MLTNLDVAGIYLAFAAFAALFTFFIFMLWRSVWKQEKTLPDPRLDHHRPHPRP